MAHDNRQVRTPQQIQSVLLSMRDTKDNQIKLAGVKTRSVHKWAARSVVRKGHWHMYCLVEKHPEPKVDIGGTMTRCTCSMQTCWSGRGTRRGHLAQAEGRQSPSSRRKIVLPTKKTANSNLLQAASSWETRVDVGRRHQFPEVVYIALRPDLILRSNKDRKIIHIQLTVS